MKTQRTLLLGFLGMCSTPVIHAQNDGDHCITDNFGTTYLNTDTQQSSAPFNVTIGTTPTTLATLIVRGDQLPVDDPFFGAPRLCTFRTDVAATREQSWWMYRDNNHIGRIWHDAGNRAFHFQSMEPVDVAQDRFSGAMVQNHQNDGLWVSQNGVPEGARLFPNALQVLNRDGYMALGASEGWLTVPTTSDIRGPWTRLHLFDQAVGTRPYFGWRSQMRNGMLFTGNSDLGYMGHWYDQGETGSGTPVNENSKVVFGVAENALPVGFAHHQDHFSFRFFSDLAGQDGAASGLEGLEMMRIRPYRAQADAPVQGFVGIGDFLSAATGPEERLDILNGRLRIRELPLAANENANLTKYLVTDATGVVFWRNVPGSGGGGGCEWDQVTGSNNLRTAWSGAASGCPDALSHVGIGTANPAQAKLTIEETATLTTGATERGLSVLMKADAGTNLGALVSTINASAGEPSIHSTGLEVNCENASGTIKGIYSNAMISSGMSVAGAMMGQEAFVDVRGSANSTVFGSRSAVAVQVGGSAQGAVYGSYSSVRNISGVAVPGLLYGVYAKTEGPSSSGQRALYGITNGCTDCWAVYAEGKAFLSSGTLWSTSDEGLKQDIQSLDGPEMLEKLLAIETKSFAFRAEEFGFMGLEPGLQRGVISAQLGEIFPDLVMDMHRSGIVDEEGNVDGPDVDFKAVNYMGLIPVTIASVQELYGLITAQATQLTEQAAVLDEVRSELAEMRSALASCCANPANGDTRLLTDPEGDLDKAIEGDARSLHIQPNPFTERTTLHYRLERSGRMQLLANSADGKALKVLQEASLEAGAYQFNWETGDLNAGVYYVTLLLDGEPIVKKAVKVSR